MLRGVWGMASFCKFRGKRQGFDRPNQKEEGTVGDEYLYGINPVQIAINAKRRILHRLYIEESEANTLSSRVSNIVAIARQINLDMEVAPRVKMDRLCEKQPHQHVVLRCSPLEYINIVEPKELGNLEKLTVFVDKVTDPQNFGAILRSCHFYGVNKVIVNQQHKCPLNSTVSKTSAGALELMDVFAVKGTTNFVQRWKQEGNRVLCTGMPRKEGKVTYLDELETGRSNRSVMLIVGSEATGVSPHLMALADQTLMIKKLGPKEFPFSLVDSLNVNAATCAILYELTRHLTN